MKRTVENITRVGEINDTIIEFEAQNEQLNKVKELCNIDNKQKIVCIDIFFKNDEDGDFKSMRNVRLFTPKDIEALTNAKLKNNNASIESLTAEFEKL